MAKRNSHPRSLQEYLRLNPEVTQKALARALGISEGYLSKIKSGQRPVGTLAFACRIEAATGIPAATFLENPPIRKGRSLVA